MKTLSIFSGGGFLDLGFAEAGFDIEEAVEIDSRFIAAYNSGLSSHAKHSNGKCLKFPTILNPIDASNISNQIILGKKFNGISGIFGGPPCQDYSVGGSNNGVDGERGKLIYSYFEILNRVKPQFVFFENVAGLYNTKEHRKAFDDLKNKIKEAGYVIWNDVLNSLDYGVPQDRARLTLVAFRKEIVDRLKANGFIAYETAEQRHTNAVFRWPTKKFKNAKNVFWPAEWDFGSRMKSSETKLLKGYEELTVGNAFEGLTNKTPNQKEHFEPKSDKFQFIPEGDTNRKSFKRLHRYRYSPTVAYGNNEVHLHPTEARRISVREALRLQSVPDTYILPGVDEIPLTHKFKLISNGVPCKKAQLVAKEIRRTLELYQSVM